MIPSLPKLRVQLPDQVIGLHFDHSVDYEELSGGRSPGLGVSLSYIDSVRKLDIYEYTLGRNDIGTGGDSDAVQEEFQRSIWELTEAHEHAIPAGNGGVLTLPGGQTMQWYCAPYWLCRSGSLDGNLQESWLESFVGVTGWEGVFVKLRFSQYLGQAVGSMLRANIDQLDQMQPMFTQELFFDAADVVSDLIRRVQSRDSIHTRLEADARNREAEFAKQKEISEQKIKVEFDAGKRCPSCRFKFAWDGFKCGHCHFQKNN